MQAFTYRGPLLETTKDLKVLYLPIHLYVNISITDISVYGQSCIFVYCMNVDLSSLLHQVFLTIISLTNLLAFFTVFTVS